MLDRFRVEERLRWPSRSAFYGASDVRFPARRVLVKAVDPEAPSAPWLLDRLRREVELGVLVRETGPSGWVTIYDHGDDLVVMERVDGAPMSDVVALGGWHWRACCERMARVAHALAAAHVIGIAHGELTPKKVLFDASFHAKVVDLGAGSMGLREAIQDDVWSLGVLLYLALTGQVPSVADDSADGPATERPLDPRLVRPEVPAPLAELTLACTRPHRSARPTDAAAVEARLLAI